MVSETPRPISEREAVPDGTSPRPSHSQTSEQASEEVSPPKRSRGRPRRDDREPPAKPTVGKPYKSFPLTPHRNGQFCKKIRGVVYYFGSVKDPEAALKRYHLHCNGLHTGELRAVDRDRGGLTVRELANRFMEAADGRRDAGELSDRTFTDYYRDCARLIKFLGADRLVESITQEDLLELRRKLARGVGPTTLNGRVGVTRSILSFAYDAELIEKPIRYSKVLRRPSKKTLRRSQAQAGRKHFHAKEIRTLLKASPPELRAMILLGINCGLGNTDVAALPTSYVDLEHRCLDYPRAKTGVRRRCPLWPETIEAINAVLAAKKECRTPERPEVAGLLFVTRNGFPYVRSSYKTLPNGKPSLVEHDVIATKLKRIMEKQGIAQPGLGFYGLRNSFETIGAETGNQVAVDHIMGHIPHASDMGAVYRRHIAKKALLKVTRHVHKWLFGGGASDQK